MSLLAPVKRLVPNWFRTQYRQWRDAPPPALLAERDRAAKRTHFMVDSLRLSADRIALDCWVAGPAASIVGVQPLWNGKPFDKVETLERPDVLTGVPFFENRPGIAAIGFRASVTTKLAYGTMVSVGIADKSVKPVWDYLADPSEPEPDAMRRQRVHGVTDLDSFRRVGATAFVGLRDGLKQTTGHDLQDLPRILDWGCGCGRITRHLGQLPVQVTGVDVDADNVGWCQANMGFGDYQTIPLHPPTQLPAASFDLAIGVSIFTHLKEPDQFEWLAELQRLVRPGGILLMTTHGEETAAATRLPGWAIKLFYQTGFCDFPNQLYDADLSEADYYRNTLHTSDYLRREWGKYFEVVAILSEQVATQNLVVLRRR
jgi:SAM-dependent methyltransferase